MYILMTHHGNYDERGTNYDGWMQARGFSVVRSSQYVSDQLLQGIIWSSWKRFANANQKGHL